MVSFLFFFPVIGAVICFLVGKGSVDARNGLATIVTVAEFAFCIAFLTYPDYELHVNWVAGEGIFLKIDGFRRLYTVIVSFVWTMTTLMGHNYFEGHERTGRYYFFSLVTLGETMGVFLSGNLYTALVFFEMMSFTSFVWVAQEETAEAIRAAETYLAVAVIGGLMALGGILVLKHLLGTTDIDLLYEAAVQSGRTPALYAAGILILLGFGAKAGMFPLHIWLSKAHPAAPAPASALLSGILTKTGIFGVLVLCCRLFRGDAFWGSLILLLGLITMLLGAVLALFSVDLKRTLACSSVSQIGFILIGSGLISLLGEEAAIAARGTLLHMVNHSMFKLVLFMCAGVVYARLHKLNLNDIRGFGRKRMLLGIAFAVGALGISGVPLFSGYVSKTLLHDGLLEYMALLGEKGMSTLPMRAAEGLFLLSGGCTFAYMLKLFVCLFIDRHPTRQHEFLRMKRSVDLSTGIALFLSAALIVILGITADFSMNLIADVGTDFFAVERPEELQHFLNGEALLGAGISLGLGLIIYFGFVRTCLMKTVNGQKVYIDRWPSRLDLEELLYRPLLCRWLPALFGFLAKPFGENRLLGPAAEYTLKGSAFAASFLGENKALAPAAKAGLRGTGILARLLGDSADAGILGLRLSLFRDRHYEPVDKQTARTTGRLSYRLGAAADRLAVRRGKEEEGEARYANLLLRAEKTTRESRKGLHGNLSYALLWLCLAVCAVFLYILILH